MSKNTNNVVVPPVFRIKDTYMMTAVQVITIINTTFVKA